MDVEADRLHTLSHWKAIMEYHKTEDILYVVQLPGYRRVQDTLIYTLLITFKDYAYSAKAAKSDKEI